jgi:hypothetical protein
MTINLYTDDGNVDMGKFMQTLVANLMSEMNGTTASYETAEGTFNVSLNFNFQINNLGNVENAIESAEKNTSMDVNYFYVTGAMNMGVDNGMARGGNAGILNSNTGARSQAHEIMHTMGYFNPNSLYPKDDYPGEFSHNLTNPKSLMYYGHSERERAKSNDYKYVNRGYGLPFTKSSSGNIFGAPITNAIYNNQNIINMERDKNLNYIKPVYSNGVNGGDVYQVTNKRINIWEKRK